MISIPEQLDARHEQAVRQDAASVLQIESCEGRRTDLCGALRDALTQSRQIREFDRDAHG